MKIEILENTRNILESKFCYFEGSKTQVEFALFQFQTEQVQTFLEFR